MAPSIGSNMQPRLVSPRRIADVCARVVAEAVAIHFLSKRPGGDLGLVSPLASVYEKNMRDVSDLAQHNLAYRST